VCGKKSVASPRIPALVYMPLRVSLVKAWAIAVAISSLRLIVVGVFGDVMFWNWSLNEFKAMVL